MSMLWRGRSLFLLLSCLLPSLAQAALTSRVDGAEEAFNQAWQARPECQAVKVDDLLVRDDGLTLTTTTPLVLRLTRMIPADQTNETSGTWKAIPVGQPPPDLLVCAEAIQELVGRDPFLSVRLKEPFIFRDRFPPEAPVPTIWSPPGLTPLGFVWLVCCLLTLGLLAAIPVARWRLRIPTLPSALQRWDWSLILLIAAGGVAVRALYAINAPVQIDEQVSLGYDSLWREFDGRETVMNPPLYRLLCFPFSFWTEGAAAPSRLVPVILGVLLIFVMARVGDLLAGRLAGYTAALLTAFHPGLTQATAYHRAYAPLLLATALTIWALLVALRRGGVLDRYLVAVCASAAFLSHYFGVTVILGAATWLHFADRRHRREWAGPGMLIVVLCLPYVPALLSGAQAKELSTLGVSGFEHARQLLLSIPAMVAGAIRFELQMAVYSRHAQSGMLIAALLLLAVVAYGAWRSPRSTGLGLLSFVFGAMLLPIVCALKMTTIREVQAIPAAIPAIALASVAVATFRQSWARSVAFALVFPLAIFYAVRPPLYLKANTNEIERVADVVWADQPHWPIYMWSEGQPSFADVGLELGLSRVETDLSADGRHPMIRTLRACSTAAVRDAAAVVPGKPLRVLVVKSRCETQHLSGRGVSCGPLLPVSPEASITDCTIDPAEALRPGELPGQLPHGIQRRADRGIPAGNEQLFAEAAGRFRNTKAKDGGIYLDAIRVQSDYVTYRLKQPDGTPISLFVSPRVENGTITGTDVSTDPDEANLSPELKTAVQDLTREVGAVLTPARWKDVYGLITNGAGGHSSVRPALWLTVWFVVAALLAFKLVRERRSLTQAVDLGLAG